MSINEDIKCSETESISDYLLKQRVIPDKQYQDIINTAPVKAKNCLLIEILNFYCVNENNENINLYGLFINALRYAGCHFVANIMDVDEPLCGNMDNNNIRRKVKNVVYKYSEPEILVRQATSNDPWGPTSTVMSEIADLTFNYIAFEEVMPIIWKRLNDKIKWTNY